MLDTRHKLCTFILKNPPGEIFRQAEIKVQLPLDIKGTRADFTFFNYYSSPITESTDSGSASVKKEKEKKNRKKDKENGSGSGEAGNQDNFDAPQAVVSFPRYPVQDHSALCLLYEQMWSFTQPDSKSGTCCYLLTVGTLRNVKLSCVC